MGREPRRVPMTWEHPRDDRGQYISLRQGIEEDRQEFADRVANYGEEDAIGYFGGPIDPAEYMPTWTADVAVGWQMYENTSEGTPISPVFESPEELARWLADTSASAFGNMTASYEQWLTTIRRGWAPSGFATGGVFSPGVALPDPEPGGAGA